MTVEDDEAGFVQVHRTGVDDPMVRLIESWDCGCLDILAAREPRQHRAQSDKKHTTPAVPACVSYQRSLCSGRFTMTHLLTRPSQRARLPSDDVEHLRLHGDCVSRCKPCRSQVARLDEHLTGNALKPMTMLMLTVFSRGNQALMTCAWAHRFLTGIRSQSR